MPAAVRGAAFSAERVVPAIAQPDAARRRARASALKPRPKQNSRPTSGAGAGGEGSGGAESGDGGAADDEPADMGFQPRGISSIDSVTTAASTLGRHSRERPADGKSAGEGKRVREREELGGR